VLRARREELQVGYETIEAMCDLPSGYAGKLLTGWKAMGALSMWLILRTLGLNIQLIEDPATLARNRRHHHGKPSRASQRNGAGPCEK
jgi:hypothetical protein